MRTERLIRSSLLAGCGAAQLLAQTAKVPMTPEDLIARNLGPIFTATQSLDEVNRPFPPHKIIGNVYFVGPQMLGSFLISTSAGLILINSDYEVTVLVIRTSVEKLGFKFTDIKILLGSHAHPDHMEGDALVKELTGAKVMTMEQDVPNLQAMRPGGKPHPIDRVLHDGDQVTLGGTTLVAHLTPGHTKGCTTWTMKVEDGGKSYNVVIIGSVGVNPGVNLVNNANYPQIADDFARSSSFCGPCLATFRWGRIHRCTGWKKSTRDWGMDRTRLSIPMAVRRSWTSTRMFSAARWSNSNPRQNKAHLTR